MAALFVDAKGVYSGLEGVDVWGEDRDARLYAGPFPVVAHPPCARWSRLASIHQHRWPIGADDGCFKAALRAVETWGGVLEHPAGSYAWAHFGLPRPGRGYWFQSFTARGWVTEVSQVAYGHPAQKRTWLYYVGAEPFDLDWSEPPATKKVENQNTRSGAAARTPPAFRDVLLELAGTVALEAAA